MNAVIKEIGFYNYPEKTGYVAWIRTSLGNYFVTNDGAIIGPYKEENTPESNPETDGE